MHSLLRDKVIANPSVLIPLFICYIFASLVGGLAFLLPLFPFAKSADSFLIEGIWKLLFSAWLILLWSHFLYLNIFAFAKGAIVRGDTTMVLRIVQLFGHSTFVFAIMYYYAQLLSGNRAFSGMATFDIRKFDQRDIIDLLLMAPDWQVLLDCIYFSVVTITTLGYGEMHPATNWAKVICMTEVLLGFVLVVISLGSVIGSHNPDVNSDQ